MKLNSSLNPYLSKQSAIPAQRWWRIIPPILLVCIISYMDRINIAFAIPGGMSTSLGMSASMAGLAGGIFFIGYLFLQIPGGRLAALGGGKRFVAWSLVSWAVISLLTGLVHETWQLLTLRFLLGLAEGGMLPVVLTMVSAWFPDHERGRANAMVIMFVPLAGMITSPLAGMMLAYSTWHSLFYVTGILSLVALLVWIPFASDNPQSATWLSQEEKNYLLTTLRTEQKTASQSNQQASSFSQLLRDKTLWHLIAINFCYQVGIYGYTMWLPTLLKSLTQGAMGEVGLLAIFPYLATMAGMLLNSALSDRSGKRRSFLWGPLLGFAVCLFLSVHFHESIILSYLFLVGSGFFLQSAAAIFWTIPPKICNPLTAGSARGAINALGNLGGFCGPYAVGMLIQHYNANVGIYCLVGALVLAALLSMILPKYCDQ